MTQSLANLADPHITFKMSDGEFQQLVLRLNSDRAGRELDLGTLYPLKDNRMPILLHQPGGTCACFEVMACGLGGENFVFLHGGFVHEDTVCESQFTTLFGAKLNCSGKVRFCRHVERNIHEVVVTFDQPVDVADISPEAVSRHILLVEDDDLSADITEMYLAQLNSTVVRVTNGKDAVEKAMGESFDLILMDIRMPEMDGIEATKKLRQEGYNGTIAALSAYIDNDSQALAIKSGCDRFIGKPFSLEEIREAVSYSKEEPLISTLPESDAARTIIGRWIAQLPEVTQSLREARNAGDNEKLAELACELRSKGTACGFEPISCAAYSLEALLTASESKDAISTSASKLERLCGLVRLADPPEGSDEAQE